jgi:hypothetical protein
MGIFTIRMNSGTFKKCDSRLFLMIKYQLEITCWVVIVVIFEATPQRI